MSLKHLLCELKKCWKQIGSRTVSTCTICTSKYSALAIRNFPLDVIRETQYQDRSQHPCRGSFVCSFLMRDAVDVKVMSLAYCIDLLCRPSTGARAASSTLLCPEVLPIAPTLRELGAKIPLADSLSKDLCRVSKESYTLSKKPCSLWQLNYGTNMLVALVVGTLGRIFFHFLCRFAGCLDCNPASCHDISLYDCTPCVINPFSLSGFPGFSLGFKIV